MQRDRLLHYDQDTNRSKAVLVCRLGALLLALFAAEFLRLVVGLAAQHIKLPWLWHANVH